MTKSLVAKKSAPRIGRVTLAIKKRCCTSCPGAKEIFRDRLPKVLIEEPLAAMRFVVFAWNWSVADAGNTHSSAPESTKNDLPERRSVMDMVPAEETEAEEMTAE